MNHEAMQIVNEQVRLGAWRWLHSVNLDQTSSTYGVADREYWAWKIKDFPNGTWQAGMAAFLDARPLLPELSDEAIRHVVEAALIGTQRIQRSNGGFEEAYPYESSYAVTGLVLVDLLYAFLRYPGYFSDRSHNILITIVQPAARFLLRTPETHGIIANHLASTLMALYLAQSVIDIHLPAHYVRSFFSLQHPTERWFPEYGGCDPGYQLLLNHYLMLAHVVKPLPAAWREALHESVKLCARFTFPDGSFSGEIGHRGTAIVYPAGTLLPLETGTAQTDFTQWVLHQHLAYPGLVSPTSVDSGNFVPVWQSWALFYSLYPQLETVPVVNVCELRTEPEFLKDAGFIIHETGYAKCILSTQNGVLRKTVAQEGGWADDSLAGLTKTGWTTQAPIKALERSDKYIRYQLQTMPRRESLNSAWKTIVLRLAGVMLYPFPPLHRLFKKQLARLVMNKRSNSHTPVFDLVIHLDQPHLPVEILTDTTGWTCNRAGFHQHMASANTFSPRFVGMALVDTRCSQAALR